VAESKVVKAGKRVPAVETKIRSESEILVAVGLTSLVVRS
jgi:acyl-coenzyme A thioesterase PaaI-like protein